MSPLLVLLYDIFRLFPPFDSMVKRGLWPKLGYFKNALFGTFRLFLLVQASTSPKKKFIAGLLMPASFRFWCQP